MIAEEQIVDHDKMVLAMLADGWRDAPEDKKEKWMDRINTALDARILLMRKRDECNECEQTTVSE